jgi:multicomponent Na+:H+ antiporter subunit G
MDAMVDLARSVLGALLTAASLCLMLGGCVGLLRMPDFYTRVHAGLVVIFGAVAALLGLACVAGEAAQALKLLVLAALVVVLGPTLSQIAANSAHTGGIAPLAGRIGAERTGRHGANS